MGTMTTAIRAHFKANPTITVENMTAYTEAIVRCHARTDDTHIANYIRLARRAIESWDGLSDFQRTTAAGNCHVAAEMAIVAAGERAAGRLRGQARNDAETAGQDAERGAQVADIVALLGVVPA